jgi:hypothetical protein
MPSLIEICLHRQPHAFCSVVILGLLLAAGCGKPSNGRLAISGNVTLDGAPLDQGVITFTHVDRKLPSSGGMIINGEYQIPDGKGLLPGTYNVTIDSADENNEGGNAGPYTMVIPRSKIPAQYNTETILKADVTSDGDNFFVFELSTR